MKRIGCLIAFVLTRVRRKILNSERLQIVSFKCISTKE